MLDTPSLFESLETDHTQRRVASRRALALAHNRVEHNLGRFLRAAQSEEEFMERLGLLEEDFAGYVTTASTEVGHDNPAAIAAALKDHYRLAAKGVEFAETPAEKQEEQEEEEAEEGRKTHTRWGTVKPLEGKQGSPLGDNSYEHSLGPSLPPVAVPPGAPIHQGTAQETFNQDDDSSRLVTCPECGGDGKTAGATQCRKCSGKGKVPNFGDSMVDALGEKSAADGNHNNTDLDGPEPKMKKEKWTPQSVGKPEVEDGRWPTKEKDIVEPIKATNDSDPSEIGEKFTERETLPTNSGDAGFDSGGPGPAPHTDTFGNDGQTDPVTNTALSHTNPLSELLTSEFPPDAVVNEALLSMPE